MSTFLFFSWKTLKTCLLKQGAWSHCGEAVWKVSQLHWIASYHILYKVGWGNVNHLLQQHISRTFFLKYSFPALFTIARTWKQPRCPLADECIRKLCYIYTMEYYSAIKKNTFESVLMRWLKLEPIIQSEVSLKEKHQYSILTHIYGIRSEGTRLNSSHTS